MAEQLPVWNNPGIEPSTDLKVNGWQPGQKPSAQHFNWLFNRAYKCLEELQGDSSKITELEQTLTELEQTVTLNDEKFNEHLADTATGAHKAKNIAVEDPDGLFTASDVEDVLKELFTNADNAQKGIASVVGLPATSSDTLEQLITHIQNAKNTMATNLTAKGISASGAEALQALANKIANVNTGKKWASGTATVSSNTETVYYVSGSPAAKRTVTVPYSAIGFIPSTIIMRVKEPNIEYRTIYEANENDSLYPNACKDSTYNNGQLTASTFNIKADVAPLYVNENGFKLPTNAPGGLLVEWVAFE
ncbi:hypothetical protein ACFPOH_07325 [Ureibacillus suwonensis]|uniref:Tail fiber protein n=1 Tax=Ureibacillus suwonensis TaxID=313007 RepID=A0ABW0R9V6_9BACL